MRLQSLLPVAFAPVPYTAVELATTPYTAIQLQFHAEAPYAPDGDSIRMKAVNPRLWPSRVKRSPRDGTVQSRMEGIDAHELHFYGYSQHWKWAADERDHLFKLLQIQKDNLPPDGVPGWALTRGPDLYGRCVSFLFPDGVPLQDGGKYMVGDASFLDLIGQSANVQMLSAGMAYPMIYEYLPDPMLQLLQRTAEQARTEEKGFWPEDKTLEGARFFTTDDAEEILFLPKLFRRLIRFFDTRPKDSEKKGLQGFWEFLDLDPDQLHLASGPAKVLRSLHDPNILEIDEVHHRLRLLQPPENLIFHEREEPNPRLPSH